MQEFAKHFISKGRLNEEEKKFGGKAI